MCKNGNVAYISESEGHAVFLFSFLLTQLFQWTNVLGLGHWSATLFFCWDYRVYSSLNGNVV